MAGYSAAPKARGRWLSTARCAYSARRGWRYGQISALGRARSAAKARTTSSRTAFSIMRGRLLSSHWRITGSSSSPTTCSKRAVSAVRLPARRSALWRCRRLAAPVSGAGSDHLRDRRTTGSTRSAAAASPPPRSEPSRAPRRRRRRSASWRTVSASTGRACNAGEAAAWRRRGRGRRRGDLGPTRCRRLGVDWRGMPRGSVLAVRLMSWMSLPCGAAGGIGSLPAPNSGGNDGRRVSGRDSLISSRGQPGRLGSVSVRASRRAHPPGGGQARQEPQGVPGIVGAWAGFGASRGAAPVSSARWPAGRSDRRRVAGGLVAIQGASRKLAGQQSAPLALATGCRLRLRGLVLRQPAAAIARGWRAVGRSSVSVLRIDARISSRLCRSRIGLTHTAPHSHATAYVPGSPDLALPQARS